MRTDKRAYTIAEMLIVFFLFGILSTVLLAALRQVSSVWYRSSARDDAIRQVLKARTRLMKDLANSSGLPKQFATATVPAHHTGFDGDALTFLSSDDGSAGNTWTVDPSTGVATYQSQITYYLIIPNAANSYGITASNGPADAAGYEQQDPFKWLVRRVDKPAPTTIPTNWTDFFATQPSVASQTAALQVVADQILQFRVLHSAPTWSLQISAVAISDAQRQIAVGRVPLGNSPFTLVEQFAVPANN